MVDKYACKVCSEGIYKPSGVLVTGGLTYAHVCNVCGAEKKFDKPNLMSKKPRKRT